MRWEVLFKTIAIIVAAGQGKRMGSKVNKQYLNLKDRPVLAYTLEAFDNHSQIHGIVVVAKEDEIDVCYREVIIPFKFKKVIKVVSGGKERQDSVYEGLKVLPDECELVVVHDGARPLIAPNIISDVINVANDMGASITAVPVKDTIKRVNDKKIVKDTIPRSELWAVQTPQVFKKNIILKAYEIAFQKGFYGTDDSSLVEMLGQDIKVVLGSYENIKITTPEDLEIGCSILTNRQKSKG